MKRLVFIFLTMVMSIDVWSAMPIGYTFYTTTNGVSTAFTALSSDYKCAIGIAWNSTLRTSSSNPTELGAGISTDYQGSFVIPSMLSDQAYRVTEIGYKAFYKCQGITAVSIPNSITYIDVNAFNGCTSLTQVLIPGSVSIIDQYAFMCCHNLTKLILQEGIKKIEYNAFLGCKSLKSVDIPASVTTIGSGAFGGAQINHEGYGYGSYEGCDNLKSVIVHWDNPINLNSGTFSNAANAVLYVPEGTIDKYANANGWKDFGAIKEIVPCIDFEDEAVKNICVANWDSDGDGQLSEEEAAAVISIGTVFQNNTEITSFSEFKYFTGVTTIGEYALSGCTNLSTIEFPSSLTTIARYALYNSGFKNLVFPDNVTSIGNSAVRGCTSLESVKIGNNSVSFGKNVFRSCSSLSSITFDGTECHFNGEDAFRDCGALTSVIITDISAWCKSTFSYAGSNPAYVTKSLLLQTSDNTISSIKHLVIPDDIATINYSAFYGCESLESIVIPSSVPAIGNYAFSGCSSLTAVIVVATEPIAITSYVFSNRANATLYVPTDSKTAYEAADYWKEFKEIRTPLTNGDTFTATTVEGVVVTYQVTNSDLRECQVGYTYEKKKGTRIAINESTSGDITIPDVVNGYTVKKIGDYAFYRCKNLTKVNLPSSIKAFGKNAFYDCNNLEPFELPSDLTYISEGMFAGWKLLVNITLPPTVTSIGSYAFNGCTNLESINTENVKSIGSYAFYGCSKLTSICIPVGTTSIGQGTFENCSSLSAINIPEGVTSIGINAFTGCRSLKEITIPGTVNKMETWDNCWAFSGCSGLQTIILKKGVSVLGNNTFSSCYNVGKVIVENMNPISVHTSFDDFYTKATLYVPNGAKEAYLADSYWSKFKTIVELEPVIFADANVKNRCVSQWDTNGDCEMDYLEAVSIKSLEGAFRNTGITSFNELKYFTGITEIHSDEFYDCGNLTSIIIPSHVTTIGNNAFYGCNKLTSVTVENFTPCKLYQNSFPNRANATLYVPIGCKTAYEAADYWHEFKSIVEVDAVSTYIAFADPSVKEICITSTNWDSNGDGELSVAEAAAVTDLGEVFSYTSISSFNELRFFTGLKVIGDNAFSGCKIEALTLPQGIEKIGDHAFSSCSSLSSVSLPDGLTTIGNSAFTYCTKLTNVIIPNSVTSIGGGAFANCSGLSSIRIPSSVTSIGSGAFSYCGGLDSFVVEEGNVIYDSRDNCNALIETATNSLVRGTKNTIIPISVTSIGAYAFSSLKELSDITIPNSVTSIGNNAFNGCNSLTSIIIPYGVNSIGENTFYNCSSLTSVSIPNSITSIGRSAFSGCI